MEPRSICSPTSRADLIASHHHRTRPKVYCTLWTRSMPCNLPTSQSPTRAASACSYEYGPTRSTCAIAWMPNELNIDVSEARSGELRGSSDGHPLTPNNPPLSTMLPTQTIRACDSCASREQCEYLPGRVCQGASKCAPADCVRDGLITWGWWSARAMHGMVRGRKG